MKLLVVFGLLVAGLSGCSSTTELAGTQIRIRNASNVAYEDVIVGDKSYGDIAPDAVSDYQNWEQACRYAYVSLTAEGKPMKIQPIDFVGETPLGSGRFTYVLTVEGDRLGIRVE